MLVIFFDICPRRLDSYGVPVHNLYIITKLVLYFIYKYTIYPKIIQ